MTDMCVLIRITSLVAVALFCASCQYSRPLSNQMLQVREDDTEIVTHAHFDFERAFYFFQTTYAEIRRTPEWKDDVTFPPLSPRQAEAAALSEVRRLRPDVREWSRESISLHELFEGRWIYIVRIWRSDVPYAGLPQYLHIPVLMDGRAVEGSSTDRRR